VLERLAKDPFFRELRCRRRCRGVRARWPQSANPAEPRRSRSDSRGYRRARRQFRSRSSRIRGVLSSLMGGTKRSALRSPTASFAHFSGSFKSASGMVTPWVSSDSGPRDNIPRRCRIGMTCIDWRTSTGSAWYWQVKVHLRVSENELELPGIIHPARIKVPIWATVAFDGGR
jgi:hypothetical protein